MVDDWLYALLAVCTDLLARQVPSSRRLCCSLSTAVSAAAADMWVAFAGPLTHIPMTAFWVGLLIAATYIAYGTTAIQLAWPYPLTYKNLGVAVCVGSILVRSILSSYWYSCCYASMQT